MSKLVKGTSAIRELGDVSRMQQDIARVTIAGEKALQEVSVMKKLLGVGRHVSISQLPDGDYEVQHDSKGYLPRGAKLDHDSYSYLVRRSWVTIITE